jgi:hypothetical protein
LNERIPWGKDHFTTNAWDSGSTSRISTNIAKLARAANLSYRDRTLEPLWLWYGIVNEFTARSISFNEDKFPAISGVAKEVQRNSGHTYKAGLWLEDIHMGLLWSSLKPGTTKTASYIAPSWSWASLNFDDRDYPYYETLRATYHHDLHNYALTSHAAEIINVSVANVDDDPFGQVLSGSLTIQGPCQKICLCNVPHSFLDCHSKGNSPDITFETIAYDRGITEREKASLKASEHCNVKYIAGLSCAGESSTPHKELDYLHIRSWGPQRRRVSLVLILEPKSTGNIHVYERIGMGILREPVDTADIWTTRRVTIIEAT